MSAPIQASASVQVVPASNCVRSRTRMPLRRPGDTGVTVIVELLAFISSDYTLRAPPSPTIVGHLRQIAIKKSATYKMTAIFACPVAAIAQVLASFIALVPLHLKPAQNGQKTGL